MLKLICGPSGSGKTDALMDAIRADIRDGKRAFLLVPEQQAYISERDLPEKLPQNAGLFFEVVHFSRLAEDVFREYGGITAPSVSSGIRSLFMWKVLRSVSSSLLQYKSASKGDTTLSEKMLATVSELQAGGIEAQALENAAQALPTDSPLRHKLKDIALIDAAYHAEMEKAFGNDPADRLLRMAEKLRTHDFFAGAHFYIDSFTDFTVPEYAVLQEILRQADSVTVALCTDAFRSTLPHFETVCESAHRLEKLAQRVGKAVERTVLASRADNKPEALRHLERELWNFQYRRTNPVPQSDGILHLCTAANVYEECEAAAWQLREWIMDGMSYGDIAVVVRDTDAYRGILDAALERHGIPYFLSDRTDLSTKSVSRLILSALRAVSRNYRATDIMTLLKTGLCGVDLRDSAMFEEYCETWHIGGKRFFDAVWSMNPDGLVTERSARADSILDAANRVRKRLMDPLAHLAAELKLAHSAKEYCRALYGYLCRLEIPKKLSVRAAEELERGQKREAGETVRLWQSILDTLTTLSKFIPEEELTIDEFSSVLSLLFSDSDLGSVPNLRDCVVIGSAQTLRVENVRASILLGLCEGEFPRAVKDDGILTEGDKETLEGIGIILRSRERTRSAEELFYVYRAMTKPTERLALFTVAQQTDGSKRTPSLAWSRVAFLLNTGAESFDADAMRLAESRTAEPVLPPLKAARQEARVTLRLSQSKIQAFLKCPYSYYCTYGLHLREVKDSTPTYADDGVFLHYLFEHFLKAALTSDGKLELPPVDKTEEIADAIIQDYIREVCPVSPDEMDSRLLHLYARLRKLALLMLGDILAEIRTGLFVPALFEQAIGGSGEDENTLPALRLPLADGSTVTLSGKIDRIDLYQANEKTYVRVIDYKSGKHTFSTEDVKSGMEIQLILYLFSALSAHPNWIGAGAQYLYAAREDGKTKIRRSGFLLAEEEVLQASAYTNAGSGRSKPILEQTAEEIADLRRQMCDAVTDVATRILSGEAEKTPSEDACKFCPARTHCNRVYRK